MVSIRQQAALDLTHGEGAIEVKGSIQKVARDLGEVIFCTRNGVGVHFWGAVIDGSDGNIYVATQTEGSTPNAAYMSPVRYKRVSEDVALGLFYELPYGYGKVKREYRDLQSKLIWEGRVTPEYLTNRVKNGTLVPRS